MARNAYTILFGKHERKRPIEIPRCKYKDNIKMGIIIEIGNNVNWNELD